MKTILISYYCDTSWSGNYYTSCAQNLKTTCDALRVPCKIEAVTHPGTWVEACKLKPGIILKHLRALETPILWIDCDCVLECFPVELDEIEHDLAFVPFYFNGALNSPHCIRSNAIFFNNTSRALDFVITWEKLCAEAKDLHFNDHEYLVLAYHIFKKNKFASIGELPESYCVSPFKRDMKDRSETVISLGLGKSPSKDVTMTGFRQSGGIRHMHERIGQIYGNK